MNGILEKYIQNFNLGSTKNPAMEKFCQLGFPTKNLESWKYTNIIAALEPGFRSNPPTDLDIEIKPIDSRIVLINGKFSNKHSLLPQGIEVEEKRQVQENLEIDDSFELLNLGLTFLTIEIKIPKNFQSTKPIEIFHTSTKSGQGYIFCPRIRIEVGPFSKVHILENFNGKESNSYFTNSLTEVILEEGSTVEYVKAVNESLSAIHIGKIKAFCDKDTNFKGFTLSLGGKITRNNIEVSLLKEGSEASAHGVFALSKDQICDNYSLITHFVANTNSNQLFKGILDDESHGIFTGKIRVNPDAQKISSQQITKNLLLSKKAHVNARPILEIYADDVKCTHGAAIGQLDPEEFFYLETRGIPKNRAQRMLCSAFALEGIDLIESTTIKVLITELLIEKLQQFDMGHLNEEV
jgi:Fe-S cluster assembly protein SufD